jgi:hypothetical protein
MDGRLIGTWFLYVNACRYEMEAHVGEDQPLDTTP